MKIPAGQEIRCADDQFYYRVWVEPLTGEQVKVEEGCLSGDFFYDKVTGKQGAAIDRWNGETSGVGLAARVTEVFHARRTYTWAALYLPGTRHRRLFGMPRGRILAPNASVLA